jgi:hypothetical protein
MIMPRRIVKEAVSQNVAKGIPSAASKGIDRGTASKSPPYIEAPPLENRKTLRGLPL